MPYQRLPDEGDIPPIKMYDPPCRLWHWLNAAFVVVLIISGYFIGTPLPSTTGDPSTLYPMGWLRLAHLGAGQAFAVAFLFRVLWAVAGNRYSAQLFWPKFWKRTWTDGFVEQIRWVLLINRKAPRYLGMNPLANTMALVLFVLPAVVTILTGFGMLAEVAGHESWQFAMFGWVVAMFGNTMDLHLYHRLAMWALLFFTVTHIYVSIREDSMGRQTVVSTILSGIRMFRK
jgi:Ni/Fe-hydrogenase 1 B-type cytochrome subunit